MIYGRKGTFSLHINIVRALMSLLSYSRSINPTKNEKHRLKPDFAAITNKYSGKDYSIPQYFIDDFVKKFDLKSHVPSFSKKDHYISTKGSPFGKATASSNLALSELMQKGDHILDSFKALMGEETYDEMVSKPIIAVSKYPDLKKVGRSNGELGKLAIVNDPELKLRVIAMLDY